MNQRVHLTGLTQPELVSFSEQLGLPAYRGRQLFAALQHRRLRSFEEISDLPKDLHARLNEVATASSLNLESRYISADGTRRYLMKTHDNLPVETVFIPEERRDTICFSSQSGCPLQCTFCLTAQLGLLRSLTTGEIVEQIVIALNDAYGVGKKPPRGTNLVGMGAGEPFLNFEALMKALRIMAVPEGLHIVPNRVTVSTAGIVPRILDLAKIPDRPHLAISLAAPTDELRDELMPINKKWPLEVLLSACKEFEKTLKASITYSKVNRSPALSVCSNSLQAPSNSSSGHFLLIGISSSRRSSVGAASDIAKFGRCKIVPNSRMRGTTPAVETVTR